MRAVQPPEKELGRYGAEESERRCNGPYSATLRFLIASRASSYRKETPLKHGSQHAITYAPPAEHDQKALRAMARESFSDTFAHHYEPGPFREFLDRTYGANGAMDRDLNDPTIQWLVAFYESEPVGYAKLTSLRAPVPSALPGAVELQQIYVLSEWHGRGVAPHLMEWALATASADDAPEIYLTVFDHNERAKRFYRRYGFAEDARCTFTLGDRVDDDRVWRLPLRGPDRPFLCG
jgi:diamine N-acetyltransferase